MTGNKNGPVAAEPMSNVKTERSIAQMARVTMYRCDVCGKLQEEELPISIDSPIWYHDKSLKDSFKFSFEHPSSYSHDIGACSTECVKTMFIQWLDARVKEHEIETAPVEQVAEAMIDTHLENASMTGDPA